MTNFGMTKRVGNRRVSSGSHICTISIPRGWTPAPLPKTYGASYIRPHHSMTNSNQILHGDRTRKEENFYAVDHAPDMTGMLTRDLFTVANPLFV